MKHRERNLLGQKSVRALHLTILKLLLLFYFSKRLSVATLFWNWKKILKKNYACSGYKCSLLQNCFSVLCWCVPPCECNIPKVDLSVTPVNQLKRQLGVRLFYRWYYTWPGVGILARKSRLVRNWYSFLGHEYNFFNAIVYRLIALKTLNSQILGPSFETPQGFCHRPQAAITIASQLLFL